jgi:2,4-dienoyl-CoA reductase-like NADH-dependent reductase (Old Yellow Enzyme family)
MSVTGLAASRLEYRVMPRNLTHNKVSKRTTTVSLLFSPMKLGNLEIQNRFVHSATHECMATDLGEVTDRLVKRYGNLAKGGIGLIIPGFMYVGSEGRAAPRQTGIHSDAMIPGLSKIVEEVHRHKAKVVFQLVHAGRQTDRRLIGRVPKGPSSAGRDPINIVKPRAMTEEDIYRTILAFGKAAKRAMLAGADGVQLHAAHGYLINQFLSPFFNRRTDSWGGTEERCFRFLEKVLEEVRDQVPSGTPILVKLNTNDHTPSRGITPELAKYYAQRLAELNVDGVEISSGTLFYSLVNTCRGTVPVEGIAGTLPFWMRPIAKVLLKRSGGRYPFREAYHLEAAKIIKPVLGRVPLLIVGGMRSVSQMERLVKDGYTDFISMSRPFIREPFLVNSIRDGRTDHSACESCNKCLAAILNGMPVACYCRSNAVA